MSCPICNEVGCNDCDEGIIRIKECPLDYIGYDACKYVKMVELIDKGMLPVSGGVLEQSHKFISIAEFVWACEVRATERQNSRKKRK